MGAIAAPSFVGLKEWSNAVVLDNMISATSPSNLLALAKPHGLQRPAAKLAFEDGIVATDAAKDSGKKPANADRTEAQRADAGNSDGKAAARPAGKTIVDQRVTDTPLMRLTFVSYSDGSSETLKEIKTIDQAIAAPASLLVAQKAQTSLTQPGMMIDKLA